MLKTPMTVGQMMSLLASLPSHSPIYLASDAEGNIFAPVGPIGHSPTNAVLVFPTSVTLDEDDQDEVLGTSCDLVSTRTR